MSLKLAIEAAQERHLAAFMEGFPASITLAGATVKGAANERRRNVMGADGGFVESKSVEILLPMKSAAEATLINATTGVDKRQTLTVDTKDGRTARTYRITRVVADDLRTHWRISGIEAVN